MFPILEALEAEIDINRDRYQQRMIAFLGERLFNLFIEKVRQEKNLKIRELDYIMIDPEGKKPRKIFGRRRMSNRGVS